MTKQTKTHIPSHVTRVRNAVTGEVKMNNKEKQQLNLDIARLLMPECGFEADLRHGASLVDESNFYGKCYDYTDNWGDLMPEIMERGIYYIDRQNNEYSGLGRFLVQDTVGRVGSDGYEFNETVGDELQIALCQCLLQVLQEKEGEE